MFHVFITSIIPSTPKLDGEVRKRLPIALQFVFVFVFVFLYFCICAKITELMMDHVFNNSIG